jgi:RNA polymerase sigma factor (sigma-70 family)
MARQLAAQADPISDSPGRTLLEMHYDLIQQKLTHLGRRSGLPEHEAEELRSWALFKLVENDYRLLAAWEGRSSFSTYLTVLLVNLMRDYRIHVWGKWRPSATAQRRGREAVLLERLWMRDGLSLDEAIRRLRTEHGVSLSPAELERIAVALPRRSERRRVGEEALRDVAVDGRVEARIEAKERLQAARRLRAALLPALRTLPAEERLLLKLCCGDGLSMAAISPILGRPQRELYSARDRCLKKLRRALEGAGLSAGWLREHAGAGGWDFLTDLTAGAS